MRYRATRRGHTRKASVHFLKSIQAFEPPEGQSNTSKLTSPYTLVLTLTRDAREGRRHDGVRERQAGGGAAYAMHRDFYRTINLGRNRTFRFDYLDTFTPRAPPLEAERTLKLPQPH
jgi:hypothetical protein